MTAADAEQLASLIASGLNGEDVANEVAVWRKNLLNNAFCSLSKGSIHVPHFFRLHRMSVLDRAAPV